MTRILRIGGIWKVGLGELVDPGFWSVDLWILLQIFHLALGRSFEALTTCQWREGSMFPKGLDPWSKLPSAVSIDQLAKKNAAGRRMTPVHGRGWSRSFLFHAKGEELFNVVNPMPWTPFQIQHFYRLYYVSTIPSHGRFNPNCC